MWLDRGRNPAWMTLAWMTLAWMMMAKVWMPMGSFLRGGMASHRVGLGLAGKFSRCLSRWPGSNLTKIVSSGPIRSLPAHTMNPWPLRVYRHTQSGLQVSRDFSGR